MKTNFYVVIDDDNEIWERSYDFKESGDYFPLDRKYINKSNMLSHKKAKILKDELSKNIKGINFHIKRINITFTNN